MRIRDLWIAIANALLLSYEVKSVFFCFETFNQNGLLVARKLNYYNFQEFDNSYKRTL